MRTPRRLRYAQGSAGRAAAGAVRVGNAVGASFTIKGRVLEPGEARIAIIAGAAAVALAALFVVFPRVLAYPAGAILAWIGIALLYRGVVLHRRRKRTSSDEAAVSEPGTATTPQHGR
jgi:cardiolipin synthase